MIQIIEADRRHYADLGWVKSYWLLSFSDFYDPENIDFGPLHVFNDDMLEPGTGFPFQSHNDVEIVMIVEDGIITHEDTLGNEVTLKAGEMQRITAGSGVTHSEFNLGTAPAHLFQIQIALPAQGVEPAYEQAAIDREGSRNRLLAIASGDDLPGALRLRQDATIFLADLDPETVIEHEMPPGRRLFLYMIEGEFDLDGPVLHRHDQLRAIDEPLLRGAAREHTRLILIDLPR